MGKRKSKRAKLEEASAATDQKFGATNQQAAVVACPTPTIWLEATIADDLRQVFADEKCVLFLAGHRVGEKKTDSHGVVRFDNLSSPHGEYALQLVDILEEWRDSVNAGHGLIPKPDSYRRMDCTLHPVTPMVPAQAQYVLVKTLTAEHKFQHFLYAYEDNGAVYTGASPRKFNAGSRRWNWGRGAVCNQHINFFLGYWANYNEKFTTAGSATSMLCLPLFTSAVHKFTSPSGKHRSYLDFLEPVNGYGTPIAAKFLPKTADHDDPGEVEYIRISKFFDQDGGIREAGDALITSLGDFNVYSVSDIKQAKRNEAITATKAWLHRHKEDRGLTGAEINHMSKAEIWEVVWNLDDAVAADAQLISSLKRYLTWDHHAGILLRRSTDGGPPTGSGPVELYTFSADGSENNHLPIVFKRFSEKDINRKFLFLAIWRLKMPRGGGYPPVETESNEGGISIHNPSRFVHWG